MTNVVGVLAELLQKSVADDVVVAMDADEDDQTTSENVDNSKKSLIRKLSNVYVCISELFTTGERLYAFIHEDDDDNDDKELIRDSFSFAFILVDLCDEADAEEKVVAAIGKALEVDPSNPEAVQAKAAYLLIKEDFDNAKVEMQKSLEMWLPAFEKAVDGSLEHFEQVTRKQNGVIFYLFYLCSAF